MTGRELTPFGAEVKKALVDRGMTQTALAKKLGVSPKYINLIIYGERSGKKYLPAIITILGIDPPEGLKSIV